MARNSQVKVGSLYRPIKQPWVRPSGTWVPVEKIFANVGGVWHQTWPALVEFTSNLANSNIAKSCCYNADGTISTLQISKIPPAVTQTKLCHMSSFTPTLYGYYVNRNNDGTRYDRFHSCLDSKFRVVNPNTSGTKLGGVVYTAFQSFPHNLEEGLRTSVFNIPTNHVLVGIEWQTRYSSVNNNSDNGSYSSYKVRLLTAPVLHSNGSAATLTLGVGITSIADTILVMSTSTKTATTTCVVPNGYTARTVEFGFGANGGIQARFYILVFSRLTTIG